MAVLVNNNMAVHASAWCNHVWHKFEWKKAEENLLQETKKEKEENQGNVFKKEIMEDRKG